MKQSLQNLQCIQHAEYFVYLNHKLKKTTCNCPSECLIWKVACSHTCRLRNRVYKIYTTCWVFRISKSQRKKKTCNCPSECLIWKIACSQKCRLWNRVYKIYKICWLFHLSKSQRKNKTCIYIFVLTQPRPHRGEELPLPPLHGCSSYKLMLSVPLKYIRCWWNCCQN